MPFLQAEETKSTSSPPTTKSKTVQLRYSTEGHRAEQFVPSLSETTRTKTLQPDDVEDEIELLCDRVAEVLHVEADEAECLLARNKWREQPTIDAFLEREASERKAAGLPQRGEKKKALPSEGQVQCKICWDNYPANKVAGLWCGHTYCPDCWASFVATAISANKGRLLRCPDPTCEAAVTSEVVRKLVEPAVFEKYRKEVVRAFIADSPALSWCKNPRGCDGILQSDGHVANTTCGHCASSFCLHCSFPSHAPAPCAMMKEWEAKGGYVELSDEEKKAHRLKLLITRACPNCAALIEKNGGCPHMKCGSCNNEFCWDCLGPYPNCFCKGKVRDDTPPDSKGSLTPQEFSELNRKTASHAQARDICRDIAARCSAAIKRARTQEEAAQLAELFQFCVLVGESQSLLSHAQVLKYFLRVENKFENLYDFLLREMALLANELQTEFEHWFDGQNKKFPVTSFMPKFVALRKHYHSFIEYAKTKAAQLNIAKPSAPPVKKPEPNVETNSAVKSRITCRHCHAQMWNTEYPPHLKLMHPQEQGDANAAEQKNTAADLLARLKPVMTIGSAWPTLEEINHKKNPNTSTAPSSFGSFGASSPAFGSASSSSSSSSFEGAGPRPFSFSSGGPTPRTSVQVLPPGQTPFGGPPLGSNAPQAFGGAAPSRSLFGAATPPAAFGEAAPYQRSPFATSATPFGMSGSTAGGFASAAVAPPSLFGSAPDPAFGAAPPGSSLFGPAAPRAVGSALVAPPSLFGSAPDPAFGSAFGAAPPAFGAAPPGSLFASAAAPRAVGSAFGSAAPPAQDAPSIFGAFGAAPSAAPPTSLFAFGTAPPAVRPASPAAVTSPPPATSPPQSSTTATAPKVPAPVPVGSAPVAPTPSNLGIARPVTPPVTPAAKLSPEKKD